MGEPPLDERYVSHYRLVEALGSGSMGRVYKAWDTRLNRWVALKFLSPFLADDSAACARFRREAQAASSLEHGHICSVFDIDKDETGASVLVMAWYDGETLAKKMESGPLTTDRALEYARQIALGLAAAHRQGIVHRDIKPANVIITVDDEAVILDFGVAFLMDQTRLTQTGSQSGTLAYMAPEQFQGCEPHPSMDIWSLGVLIFEMLTGSLPFIGDFTAALSYSISHSDPLPLPNHLASAVPGLPMVMARCLAKDPRDRYESGTELASDLSVLLSEWHTGLAATRPKFQIAGRWRRRVAMGVSALVLLGAGIFAGMKGLISSSGSDRRGVAVLPFVLDKDGEPQRELGEGLGWLLANRLDHMAKLTDAFWIVPPEDVLLYGITDREEARQQLGVDRTISGVGAIRGSTLSLRIEYVDAFGGTTVTREFHDDLANLPLWQRGLVEWSMGQLDPNLNPDTGTILQRGNTQVPAALYPFLEGIAWSRRYPGQDQDLAITYHDRALSAFGKAVAQDSSFAPARSEYGRELQFHLDASDSARVLESASHLRAAIALDPRDAEPSSYQGDLYRLQEKAGPALAAYDEALEREPGFKPALLGKIGIFVAEGDEAGAERTIKAMKQARPGCATDCLALSVRYWNASDSERTLTFAREATELAPRSARALSYLGAALFEFDNDPEAETVFRRALALGPDDQIYQNLGTYYYYNNRYRDALVQYRKSLEMNPKGRYDILGNLAECYRWSPGFQDSVAIAFKRARRMAEHQLQASPSDPWLMAELATYCSVLGDTTRTLELLTDLAPEKHLGANAEFMVAVAWEDLGRRSAALAWLERAIGHGLRRTRVDGYPGLRNLRTDIRYEQIYKVVQ